MPELPEVETYARDLDAALRGRTLLGARATWPRQLPRNDPEELAARVAGQVVRGVTRRGKYLVARLDRDWLIAHLKMSGRFQVVPAGAPADPHAHVAFALDGGDELRLRDPRKFGRVYLMADPEPLLGRLGPEPLDPAFTAGALRARIGSRRARLKPLLLDQRTVAGLGNIYVDEALWAAGLHPLRRAADLGPGDVERLRDAIVDVLSRGVALRGSSLSEGGYRDLTGNMGEMQGTLSVFRRTGLPCPRCGAAIERLVVATRGTHVCPRCQPAPA